MTPIQSPPTRNKHAILLDVSLFVLNLLDPQKIINRSRDDDISLEVPSAFTTMIRDSQAGNPLLQQFIYAHLLSIRRNSIHQQSTNPEMRRLILATKEELEGIRDEIVQSIIREFAPLIDGAIKSTPESESDTTLSIYPIRRYEALFPVSADELHTLRLAYLQELSISPHPLIDLYFLQVFHAQTIGSDNQPAFRRELVSMGRATHTSIKTWKGGHLRRYENSTSFIGQRRSDNDEVRLIQNARNLLSETINRYFRPRWIPIVTATTNIFLDVVISIPQSGGIGWGTVGLAVIGYYSAELVVKAIINTNNDPPETRLGYMLGGVLLIVLLFMISIIPKALARLTATPSPTATIDPLVANIIQQPGTAVASNTLVNDSTKQLSDSSVEIVTLVPIAPTVLSVPYTDTYCSYVIQPGDTLQSVALRFQVPEIDLRSNNKLIELGMFVVNQMINVNASCCRPNAINGFSYTVQRGDTVYSISKRYGSTVDEIAVVNNLFDSRYIQTGQMLCIPYH